MQQWLRVRPSLKTTQAQLQGMTVTHRSASVYAKDERHDSLYGSASINRWKMVRMGRNNLASVPLLMGIDEVSVPAS